MIQIDFEYEQKIVSIQAKLKDLFKEAIKKYIEKTDFDINLIHIIANGRNIDPEKTIESQIGNINKTNKTFKVLVFLKERENQNQKKTIIESKEIICPICRESCRIKFDKFKIKLYDCINNHSNENINLDKFKASQNINLSKIACYTCIKANKGNTFNNQFYKCLNCDKSICPLCKTVHNPKHILINYDDKYYTCQIHNDFFIKYCKNCKKNLCFSCEDSHNNHNIVLFEKPNLDYFEN